MKWNKKTLLSLMMALIMSMAFAMTACGSDQEEDEEVAVDPGTINTYYHAASKCSKANFKNGTPVSLEYAIDWEFKACPYCSPPTSVIPGSDN